MRIATQALDALALALAGHHHSWTGEERTLYESAIHVLTLGDDCRELDLSASAKSPRLKPSIERRRECDPFLSQSPALECFPSPTA